MYRRLILFALLVVLCVGSIDAGELTGPVVATDPQQSSIVWIEGLTSDTVPQRNTAITHREDGSFDPELSVGFVGNEFVFRNDDDTLHTTHLYMHLAGQEEVSGRPLVNGATLYNIALPHTGATVERPILPYHQFGSDTGSIDVKCNLHPDERADLLVFGHPYVALTGEEGRFTIENVPPGRHDVWIWHAGTARKWATVDFPDRGSIEQVIEIEDAG
jgi:hypothetical protein